MCERCCHNENCGSSHRYCHEKNTCRNYRCFDNGCYDFFLPMMFCMLRNCSRNCRCNWVDRYDQYR